MNDKYKILLNEFIKAVEHAEIAACYDNYGRADLNDLIKLAEEAKKVLGCKSN